MSFLETKTRTYRLFQQALVAQNKTDEALEVAERGRARAFVELLASRLDYQTAEELITSNIPTLEQIKRVAREQKATLVQYSQVSEQILYIWVIQPNKKIDFRQVDLKQSLDTSLENLVTSSRLSLGIRGRSSIEVVRLDDSEAENQLKQLHKILIAPIADLLPSDPNDRVIFMPQGELFSAPFPALRDENGKYLIEKHTILTAPAIQVLDLTQQQRAKVQQANPKGLVVVGNPTMPKVTVKIGEPPEQLKPLPAAEMVC